MSETRNAGLDPVPGHWEPGNWAYPVDRHIENPDEVEELVRGRVESGWPLGRPDVCGRIGDGLRDDIDESNAQPMSDHFIYLPTTPSTPGSLLLGAALERAVLAHANGVGHLVNRDDMDFGTLFWVRDAVYDAVGP